MTSWKRRQIVMCQCIMCMLVFLFLGLTSFGYHRRHHNKLGNKQKRAWFLFLKRSKVDVVGLAEKDQFLGKNPAVAEQWENYMQKNSVVGELFEEEEAKPYWEPEPYDTMGHLANELGSGAESMMEWLQEDVVEPILGDEMAYKFGDAVHDALNTVGDWADDFQATEWDEVGQSFWDSISSILNTTVEATVDSAMEWMGNSTDWANWTVNFQRASASVSSLWNYTTEMEKQDDMEPEQVHDHLRAQSSRRDETSEAAPDGQKKHLRASASVPLPEFLTKEKKLMKYAFITTGFPNQEQESWRFETYVLGALKTYLKNTVLFYIVNVRAAIKVKELCEEKRNKHACERLIPITVACPGKDYGVSGCCQQDKGMAKIAQNYPDFDWYIYLQDDIYFRLDYLSNFVRALPNPHEESLLLSASPFQPHGRQPFFMTQAQTMRGALTSSNCSSSPNHVYPWGRPALMYSNAALQTVLPAYKRLAISQECNAFRVSANEASPIVHWMHQLPVAKLPPIAARAWDHLDTRLSIESDNTFFRQYIAFRADVKRYNFTEMHTHVQAARREAKTADHKNFPTQPYNYRFHRPTGFQDSDLFRNYGAVQKWTDWHVFTPGDCTKANKTKYGNMMLNGKWKRPYDGKDPTTR